MPSTPTDDPFRGVWGDAGFVAVVLARIEAAVPLPCRTAWRRFSRGLPRGVARYSTRCSTLPTAAARAVAETKLHNEQQVRST